MHRSRVRTPTLVAATLLAALLLSAREGRSATLSTWDGSTGNWADVNRWSTDPFYPNNGNGAAEYDATIAAGSVYLNTNVSLSSLLIDGGTLNGVGNLAVTNFTLDHGTLATTGTFTATQVALTVGTLARNLTVPATAGNTIQNLHVAGTSTLTVPIGSTLTTITGPGERETIGTGKLINQGTFVKAGGGRFYASLTMNNEGLVKVQESHLRLNKEGTHTGAFEIAAAGRLELAGTQIFQASSTISGASGIRILSGTTTIDGSVTTDYLSLAGGTLSGSGNLAPNRFDLEVGTLDRDLTLPLTTGNTIQNLHVPAGRTLTVPVGSTLTALTGPGERETIGEGKLINQGTFVKTGGGRFWASLEMNNEGTVKVQESHLRLNKTGTHTGTFEVAGRLELDGTQSFLPSATISGAGGVRIEGGTTTIDSAVNTDYFAIAGGTLKGSGSLTPGRFDLEVGTLDRDLTLPATVGNTIQNLHVAAGRTLTVPAGATVTTITGPGERETIGEGKLINQGTFVKSGGGRFYASLTMNNEGLVQVQENNLRLNAAGMHTGTFEVAAAAQLELSGAQQFQPAATISGEGGLAVLAGTATIDSAVTTSFLRLAGGTLAGSGMLAPGYFVFNGGTLGRDLTVNSNSQNAISSLTIANGFTLTNPLNGQLGATAGTVSGPGSFVNQGAITKTGTGTETFGAFSNASSGVVSVQAGTLRLSGSGSQQGQFNVADGATLAVGGQATSETTLAAGSKVTGAGKVHVAQGTLNVPGGNTHDYAGGTTVGTAGRVNIAGAGNALSTAPVTIQSGGVVSMDAANNLTASQAIVQAGGTLAVRNAFVPQTQIAAASAGTLGIDMLGFATAINLASLGSGAMSLGSSTVGSYTAAVLGAGSGNAYRLGGGGGTITLTQANVLNGDRSLEIVGPGTVVLPQAQSFAQGTAIKAGTVAVGSNSLGAGPVSFQGGALRAEGGPVTLDNAVSWDANATLAGDHDLTFSGATQLTGNRTLTVSNSGVTTIAQGITENAPGRRLTKSGTGTLVLVGDSSFTGGLSVSGGTVVLDGDQHYGGATNVTFGSKLVVQGNLLGGSVSVSGGGSLQGDGKIAGSVTIGTGSTVSPGASPGAFTLGGGLTLQSGSHFQWEIASLTTGDPGFAWDQITLTGGPLSVMAGAVLDLAFIDAATAPEVGTEFWADTRRWKVLNLVGDSTNPSGLVDFQIDNAPWSQVGSFVTLPAQSGLGVDLVWNPVPEPSSWMLLLLGAGVVGAVRRRARKG